MQYLVPKNLSPPVKIPGLCSSKNREKIRKKNGEKNRKKKTACVVSLAIGATKNCVQGQKGKKPPWRTPFKYDNEHMSKHIRQKTKGKKKKRKKNAQDDYYKKMRYYMIPVRSKKRNKKKTVDNNIRCRHHGSLQCYHSALHVRPSLHHNSGDVSRRTKTSLCNVTSEAQTIQGMRWWSCWKKIERAGEGKT